MKFRVETADGLLLDEVSWPSGGEPTFSTGKARTIFSTRRLTLGDEKARQQLSNWGNGYMRTLAVSS